YINQSFIFAIDPPQCSAYDARADQFCQSVLADRLPKCTKKHVFWCDAPRAFDGGTRVGHLRVCWFLRYQSANPLSFRHHND
ncbi:hypothetical protein BFG48_011290, partial [Acinetobacter nosocomialis]